MFAGTEDILVKYLKDENLTNEDVGYRPNSRLMFVDRGGDFDEAKRQIPW